MTIDEDEAVGHYGLRCSLAVKSSRRIIAADLLSEVPERKRKSANWAC
jgi:hypothetical protein